MARIEKTVFISYRRKDLSWALLVYNYLTENGFDVFLDFTNLPAGKFGPVIISNIKARAHFIVILTPNVLDRSDEPMDWLRREIEVAIDEKRNIVPLFFDGFDFADPAISDKLTGILETLKEYMGVEVPALFFDAAMKKLRDRFLNVALDTKSPPLSDEVKRIVEEQQNAANKALEQDPRLKSSGLRIWWDKQELEVRAALIGGLFTLIAALLAVPLTSWITSRPTPTPTPTPIPTFACVTADDILVKLQILRNGGVIATLSPSESVALESGWIVDFQVEIISIENNPLPEFEYAWTNTGIDSGGDLLHNTGHIVDYRSGQEIIDDAISMQLSQPDCPGLAPYPFFILPNKE
jgi:hypothetical protein